MAAARVSTWRVVRWIVLALLGVVGLVLGFVGFLQYSPRRGEPWPTGAHAVPDALYRTLQLIRLGGVPPPPLPWTLEVARFLLPLVAAYSVLTAFLIIFWDRAQQLRLPFWRGHTVVIGLGDKGTAFVRSLRARRERVVAIERDPDCAGIPAARALRVPVVDGDGRDPAVLRTAGVQRARAVIAVTDDDSVNAETALAARALARGGQLRPLKCLAHIDDPDLALLLEADELRSGIAAVTLDYFTVDAHAARILVSRYVVPASAGARVVVVGASALVEQFLDSLDREQSTAGTPSRVALVGLDAAALDAAHRLTGRLPHVPDVQVLDCSNQSIAEWGARVCENGTVVLVDRADDGTTLETALALRRPAASTGAAVVACVRRSPGLERALSSASGEDFDAVQAYSVITATCTAELLERGVHEQIAQSIHEQFVAQGHHKADDPSMLPWEQLAETFKESNRGQAADIVSKLRSIGCDIVTMPPPDQPAFTLEPDEVEQLARAEHERWREERARDGWTYGPKRDPLTKTHPDLLPFDELPRKEQDKDREAVRAIPLLLERAGLHCMRVRPAGDRPPPRADAAPGLADSLSP